MTLLRICAPSHAAKGIWVGGECWLRYASSVEVSVEEWAEEEDGEEEDAVRRRRREASNATRSDLCSCLSPCEELT